jgi:single stranded DNA-binding protein
MPHASAQLIGHLGEVGTLTSVGQTQYVGFRLGVNRRAKANGEWADITTWWSVRLWGERATSLAQRLAKGDQVVVHGEPFLEEWAKRDGAKASTLRLTADQVTVLRRSADRPPREAPAATPEPAPAAPAAPAASRSEPKPFDDEPPF